MSRWDWTVTAYYAADVASPKRPGDLAIQTVHAGDASRDLEVSILERREDIGRITVARYREPGSIR